MPLSLRIAYVRIDDERVLKIRVSLDAHRGMQADTDEIKRN